MTQPIISCSDVMFSYQEGNEQACALKGINLSIQMGEFVAILGPNGSGKSTLAKHFNALLQPTSGEVLVAGHNTKIAEEVWRVRQAVGMVFQNPDNQIVATIVEEDVAFGPENLGIPSEEIRLRVDASLRAVGMDTYKRHAPHLLSGGQKQRIAIAGVLAMRPQAIVLDEPTAMLDPVGRKEVMNVIKDLNRNEAITIVLITHHMNEAVLADRVIVMDRGKIVTQGPPKAVFAQVDLLRKVGLDVPQVTELALLLGQEGITLPAGILSVDEMVNALCLLK